MSLLSPRAGLLDLTESLLSVDELLEEYTRLADSWVHSGLLTHVALVRAEDDKRGELLSELGFARQQSYASRRTARINATVPASISIRLGTAEDLDAILPLARIITETNLATPVFAPLPPDFLEQMDDAHRREIAGEHATYLVAERVDGGGIVGFALAHSDAHHPLWPEECGELTAVAVDPQSRGSGIGTALALAGVSALADRGSTYVAVDWRSANQQAAVFWRNIAFTINGWRMVRSIEPATPSPSVAE
jgi:ribosomal protein S18 acetylase RimI-like enzyme